MSVWMIVTALFVVLAAGIGIGMRNWEWTVPGALKEKLSRRLYGIQSKTVSLQVDFPKENLAQIEEELASFRTNLAGLEQELGVHFHVVVSIPANVEQSNIAVQVLERRFPGFIFYSSDSRPRRVEGRGARCSSI